MGEERILAHLDFVRAIAYRMVRRFPSSFTLDDFQSAGYLGLLQADRTYDEERGVPFKIYARHCIRGHIIDEVRRADSVSSRHRKKINAGEMENIEHLSISLLTKDHGMRHLQPRAPDRLMNPETIFEHNSIKARLQDAMGKLTPRQKEAIVLYVLAEQNWNDVVARMGCTEGNLSQILSRALETLRHEFRESGGNWRGGLRLGERRRKAA